MGSIKKLWSYIKKSMNLKIILVTAICLIVFMSALIGVIYNGMNKLEEESLEVTLDGLDDLVVDYYGNYLSSVEVLIDDQMEDIFNEIHILSDIIQTSFSNRDILDEFYNGVDESTFFDDKLVQSEKYYQNLPSEPSAVFVASYMIDEHGVIDEEAMSLIDDTKFLDLIMPAFTKHGIDKLQIYFQGGENKEIFRLSPWSDLGDVVDVYPDIFDQPIWEVFNPGLASEWREKINDATSYPDLDGLLRVTPPVQDGLSGDLVLTFSQPIADENRKEFEGTISYDVSLTEIVSMVENINLSDSGFAFMTQSTGNVFAINEEGIKTLDIASDEDSTVENETGFNKLEREFNEENYAIIREIAFDQGQNISIDIREIDGEEYVFASKEILSFQSWSPEQSFFDETWKIWFAVPYGEFYATQLQLEEKIDGEKDDINKNTIMVTVVLTFVILFIIYRFNKIVTSELVKLSRAVKEAKSKKYDVVIDIDTADEVGVLANAFEDMLREIKLSFSKLEEQNDALKDEIIKRKQKDRIIDYLENFDSGTDLPNKKALLNILKDVKGEGDNFVSLVVIGLDEFRKVNEAYSWTFGDKLMQRISERLQELLPDDSLLFKLSGDEFAFIVKENKFKNLISIIEDVSTNFTNPFYVEEHEITIGSSIGISSYPYDSDDPLDIFKFASNAMVHAKEVNRGKYEFYNAEINTTARMRMEMINELRNAIDENELLLNYQPIVHVETGKVTGMEALLRWNNKSLGSIPPNVFIPLAEKTNLILSIGNWVMKRALMDTKMLHDIGFSDLNIAVNVSIMQFLEDGFVHNLEKTVSDTGINPSSITIEITEGLFINDLDKIMNVLNRVKRLGISISVDDFGTGYSSLSYIKNLPLSKLKIDRSFIREIEEEKSHKLVSGIIGLAQNLNLSLVAEGIETEEQLKVIREKKCQEAQGYYFSRPLTLEHFTSYLKQK